MKIPVTLLTGFLGSGKTTVLNQWLCSPDAPRIMVIENEVGDSNIDGALVESGVEEVVELTAGCLCCSLSDGLLDALELVSAKRNTFDHLVIETTGVADPSSIMQVFLADPMVERVFELQRVICVVDAGLIEDWLEETEEALRQIAMANVILLNKKDSVQPSYLQTLEQRIHAINPLAQLFSGENGHFPFEQISQICLSETTTFEKSPSNKPSFRPAFALASSPHKINTFTLRFEQPFVLNDYFSLQLYRLVNLHREQVYRIKGILEVAGHPNRVLLQSVRTQCVITDGKPWLADEKRGSELVFIGRGLKKEAFEKMFHRFTRKISSHGHGK